MSARESGTGLGVDATYAAALSAMSARVVVGVLEGHWSFIDARARRISRVKSLNSHQSIYLSGKQAFSLSHERSRGSRKVPSTSELIRGVLGGDPAVCGRCGHLNEARAREQDRPALCPAARRPVYASRCSEENGWDGLCLPARSASAVCCWQTGCVLEYALLPALPERSASARVGPHCSSLGHREECAGGGMRGRAHADLGRKRPQRAAL